MNNENIQDSETTSEHVEGLANETLNEIEAEDDEVVIETTNNGTNPTAIEPEVVTGADEETADRSDVEGPNALHNIFLTRRPDLDNLDNRNQLGFFEHEGMTAMGYSKSQYVYALFCLYEIHSRKLYRIRNRNFRHYLKETWGFNGKSTVYTHLQVLKPFHERLGNENDEFPDFDRLKIIHETFKNADTPDESMVEAYDSAKVLSDDAFKDQIKEWRGETPSDTCEHTETHRKILTICNECDKTIAYEEET